ncbi:MAG TPA: metalloregulator ArsR/SmtB family transcription factor [Terriglobales bacterium]|jgi:DNA-binding transcriptional ArsR family regulator|nr:metalloregulator ArsR/SmtB family transcription factor [Terriglobales bacterium]
MLNHQAIDSTLHALSAPTRRLIVERLSQGAATVSELNAPLAISLAAVVQHLRILETAGIIRSEKRGRIRRCHLRPQALSPLEQWITRRRRHWDRSLDRLAAALGEA